MHQKPGSEKTGGNPIVEILMIPVRIVQAIAGFISAFVMCFSGKSLVSGQSGRSAIGDGSAAKKGGDAKKVFINNNLLNVDKELKKNKKQEDYGFIPSSWKIVRLGKTVRPIRKSPRARRISVSSKRTEKQNLSTRTENISFLWRKGKRDKSSRIPIFVSKWAASPARIRTGNCSTSFELRKTGKR